MPGGEFIDGWIIAIEQEENEYKEKQRQVVLARAYEGMKIESIVEELNERMPEFAAKIYLENHPEIAIQIHKCSNGRWKTYPAGACAARCNLPKAPAPKVEEKTVDRFSLIELD